jgi:transposase-like protein
MSEAGVVSLKRRRRSRAEAAQLVAEYETSGLTRKAFCTQRGVSVAALDKYRRIHRQPAAQATKRLLPVELLPDVAAVSASRNAPCSHLWLEFTNERRIAVGRGFDAPTLECLVSLLDRS